MKRRVAPPTGGGIDQAFDEVRFGRARTLNLRSAMPTAAEAETRVEAWLRERQVSIGGEVLIVTGRGRGSDDGVAVVRPAVQRRLARLVRQGVVAGIREHSAGSFVVELAPIRALLSAAPRRKDVAQAPPERHPVLASLEPSTREALHALACRTLDVLGARSTESLIEAEMAEQFSRLAKAVAPGPNRESRLRTAARAALADVDDA